VKLTCREIRDRITINIACSAPELIRLVIPKVKGYIEMMKGMLLDCHTCAGAAGGSCEECIDIQKTIGWALEKLQGIEKL
jgi:hypothetical protein